MFNSDLTVNPHAWIRDLPGCREVFFEGIHPQWWMFYQEL